MNKLLNLSHLSLKFLRKYVLRNGSYLFVYYLTILENKKGWDAADTKFGRSLWVSVYVYFTNNGFAFVFACKFFYNRAYHTARSAPLCPKVY